MVNTVNTRSGRAIQVEGKTCTKCGEFKALGEFGVEKRVKDGRATRCKSCENERCKKKNFHSREKRNPNLYVRKKEQQFLYSHGLRKCPCCNDIKPLAAYRNSWCQPCNNKSTDNWRKTKHAQQHEKEYRKIYYLENRQAIIEKLAAWRKQNPEKHVAQSMRRFKRRPDLKIRYAKTCTMKLPDHKVANLLGLPVALCPPELIEVKRTILQIKRHIKETSQ